MAPWRLPHAGGCPMSHPCHQCQHGRKRGPPPIHHPDSQVPCRAGAPAPPGQRQPGAGSCCRSAAARAASRQPPAAAARGSGGRGCASSHLSRGLAGLPGSLQGAHCLSAAWAPLGQPTSGALRCAPGRARAPAPAALLAAPPQPGMLLPVSSGSGRQGRPGEGEQQGVGAPGQAGLGWVWGRQRSPPRPIAPCKRLLTSQGRMRGWLSDGECHPLAVRRTCQGHAPPRASCSARFLPQCSHSLTAFQAVRTLWERCLQLPHPARRYMPLHMWPVGLFRLQAPPPRDLQAEGRRAAVSFSTFPPPRFLWDLFPDPTSTLACPGPQTRSGGNEQELFLHRSPLLSGSRQLQRPQTGHDALRQAHERLQTPPLAPAHPRTRGARPRRSCAKCRRPDRDGAHLGGRAAGDDAGGGRLHGRGGGGGERGQAEGGERPGRQQPAAAEPGAQLAGRAPLWRRGGPGRALHASLLQQATAPGARGGGRGPRREPALRPPPRGPQGAHTC